MSSIDVWCTFPHYADHLRPIWQALPAEARGTWYSAQDDPPGGDVLVVGAYRDFNWVGSRYQRTCLVEHGIGQSYFDASEHPAYPGGERTPYDLLVAPGLHVGDPAARQTAYVGCPKLDPWLSGQRRPHARHVVLSFHWDCNVSLEAGTAFWDYLNKLEWLASKLGDLFIHSHPRIQDDVADYVSRIEGCEYVPDFEWVLDTGAVYCCDNSSTIYEFAATGRPVVQLQAAQWRPTVRHGKRFYDWADIGPIAWQPEDLPLLVETVMWDRKQEAIRQARVESVYSYLDGTSASRAAEAVLQLRP